MKRWLPILIILLLSLPAIWPIVTPGYFPIHDNTQVVRVDQMFQALQSGQFPVRWVPDLGYGYGYPIFNFYNPLPYYFGAAFMFLGVNALVATKIMFVTPILLSGLAIYWLARKYFPALAALTAAVFYVYAPYHAVQIYVRGAVGEYWAYALVPLVTFAFLSRRRFLAPMSLALLILSHNLTAMMFIPILGFLILLLGLRRLPESIKSLLLGLGLSAFFWLPAILEKNLTRVNFMVQQQFNPLDHFVYTDQLWNSLWGYAGSAPGRNDGISFMIGKSHIIFTLFSLGLIIFSRKIKKNTQKFLSFTIFTLALAVFMLLPLSYFVWVNIPALDFIQFPWRWLSFAALSTSVLTGYAISRLPKLAWLLPVFIIYSVKFFQPQFKFPITAEELLTKERVVWEVSARSDEYLPKDFIVPQTQLEALRDKNPANQQLVNNLLQPTPIRTIANLISLITVVLLVLQFSHGRLWGGRSSRGRNN